MKKIELKEYGIVVALDETGGGTIKSKLKKGCVVGDQDDYRYMAVVDGIESLVLAHACAGIDITSPEYIAGIETAVDAAINNT